MAIVVDPRLKDWEELCPDVVAWQGRSSRDEYGKPTYGAAVYYKGRRVYKSRRVASGNPIAGAGAEVVSGSEIIILGIPAVKYEDLVYVVGDAEPYPPIVNIERHSDEEGPLYVKVIFGNA